MDRTIGQMRNLGPYTTRMLAEIGVVHEADLKSLGAVEACARLQFVTGKPANLNMLYGVAAALEDIDWREMPETLKAELRMRLAERLALPAPRARTKPDE